VKFWYAGLASQNADTVVVPKLKYERVYDVCTKMRWPCE
jgi:hypothetical protein